MQKQLCKGIHCFYLFFFLFLFYFILFFLLCSLHIDQGLENKSEAGLGSADPPQHQRQSFAFLGAQANRDVKDF